MSVSSRGSMAESADNSDFHYRLLQFTRQQVPQQEAVPEFDTSFAPDFQSFESQDMLLKTLMTQTARSALANQDPCTIPDDVREEMMRQKRKDDAFKTALCDSFRRNKTCSYGIDCRFAHGVHELRLPQNPRGRNHPKYKTVLCDKFSTTGNCKYGTRCQFIHKVVNPTLLAQSGMFNTSSTSAAFNQSLFLPSINPDISMELNQSMPYRRSDVTRAFARASQVESAVDASNDKIMRLARVFDEFRTTFPNFQQP